MRLGGGIKAIIPNLDKTRNALNNYVNSNVIQSKTRLNNSMDVTEESLKKEEIYLMEKRNRYNEALKKISSYSDVIANNFSVNESAVGSAYILNQGNLGSSFTVSLNGSPIQETKTYYATDGSMIHEMKSPSLSMFDNSDFNNKIITDTFKVNVDGLNFGKDAILHEKQFYSTLSISGNYSLLPEKDEKLHNADRDFLNSILSLATYTSNDTWVSAVNEKLAKGQSLNVNDVLRNNEIFPNSSDWERVVASYYATTFTPAKVMPNGKFEAEMGSGENASLGNFEFKDGVYRSNSNLCSASSMLSKNEDGTYTLHMAYRGTDNESRASGKFSNIEKKIPFIKAVRSLWRFVEYVSDAYLDMGRHHDNFTPFDKACLEFAKNPANNVKNIEVSGHSLGGAMVQRFLKSDLLLQSGLKDKVQGITWGAPQTNANILGKVLTLSKRLFSDTKRDIKASVSNSYVEFLAISNERGYTKDVADMVSPGLVTALIFKNLSINSVLKTIPNFLSFTKNVALASLNYSKKVAGAIVDVTDDFHNDVANEIRINKGKREVSKMLSGEKRNTSTDALDILSDHMVAVSTALPKVAGPLFNKIDEIWADISQPDLPESKLRQYAHHKDPIPIVTALFASDVGIKKRLDNHVDRMPVLNHMMKGWDDKVSRDVLLNDVIPEAKDNNVFVGGIKAGAVFLGNVIETLSMGKHSMKKYTMNTLMKDSFFRRVNIRGDNSSFDSISIRDQNWLVNTPNITKFEVLLHSTRLENIIVDDARYGTQFRDHRDLFSRKFGHYDVTDTPKSVSQNMNTVLIKLGKLYSEVVPALSEKFAVGPDFSNTLNATPSRVYRDQRSWNDKMEENAIILGMYRASKKIVIEPTLNNVAPTVVQTATVNTIRTFKKLTDNEQDIKTVEYPSLAPVPFSPNININKDLVFKKSDETNSKVKFSDNIKPK